MKIRISQKDREIANLKEKLAINEKRLKDTTEQLEEQEKDNDKLKAVSEIYKDYLVQNNIEYEGAGESESVGLVDGYRDQIKKFTSEIEDL